MANENVEAKRNEKDDDEGDIHDNCSVPKRLCIAVSVEVIVSAVSVAMMCLALISLAFN